MTHLREALLPDEFTEQMNDIKVFMNLVIKISMM